MSLTAAIVPAAGRGERLGPGAPKALRNLGGSPILIHAITTLSSARCIDVVVIAAPADEVDAVRAMLKAHESDADVVVVAGGETRQDSVARALMSLDPQVDVVLVHDAARPLVPVELVEAVAAAVRAGAPAVVPGVPVTDTVKSVDLAGQVIGTLDRSSLRAIQTPQGFSRSLLQEAHAACDDEVATDDAGLVERMGYQVLVIPGHEEAFKVTRPLDLLLAESVLARRRAAGGST